MEITGGQRWTVSGAETRAMRKAIHSNGAALVERVQHGTYLVPSASRDERYVVTGTSVWARELHCTCPAGQSGRICWHVCAVQLRKAQESAKAQARRLAQREAATAAAQPIRQSVGSVTVNGAAFYATGTSALDAIAHAAEAAHAAQQQAQAA